MSSSGRPDGAGRSEIERRSYGLGPYRFALYRRWGRPDRGVSFVGLHPPPADGPDEDRAVLRCLEFAQAWGYGSLSVVNLYAFRARSAFELAAAADPIGADNPSWIATACQGGDVVLAWGASIGPRPSAVRDTVSDLLVRARRVDALGFCSNGQPRAPLFVRASQERVQCAPAIRAIFAL